MIVQSSRERNDSIMAESSGPILHVIVVGFHHKKGCQVSPKQLSTAVELSSIPPIIPPRALAYWFFSVSFVFCHYVFYWFFLHKLLLVFVISKKKKICLRQVEYSFPPLVRDSPNECPLGWKYLPTLALPDGSHNFDEDTVYFHLPSLSDPKKTVYGISCFRQIPVEVFLCFFLSLKRLPDFFIDIRLCIFVIVETQKSYVGHHPRNGTKVCLRTQYAASVRTHPGENGAHNSRILWGGRLQQGFATRGHLSSSQRLYEHRESDSSTGFRRSVVFEVFNDLHFFKLLANSQVKCHFAIF